MESALLINVFVTGLLVGLVALDWYQRAKVQRDLRDTLEQISKVHNELLSSNVAMINRVETLEMKLSGFKK